MEQNKFDIRHLANFDKYDRQLKQIYNEAADEIAKLAYSVKGSYDVRRMFSFSGYPKISKEADRIMREANAKVKAIVIEGISLEWELSDEKNDELVKQVFEDRFLLLPLSVQAAYLRRNEAAMVSFRSREVKGLTLSNRVWKLTAQNRRELELALSVALENGTSAVQLAREIKRYLNNPDMLFRRVRDKYGNLQLSKAAKNYHPGQGVYRSSYKNAMRLARTEVNMAYRLADFERWNSLDFVVGQHIMLSAQHNVVDICDDLSNKFYPKDFKWTGWHSNCWCLSVPVLKSQTEMNSDFESMLSGNDAMSIYESSNYIGSMPSAFGKWISDNSERYDKAKKRGTLPFFITDNKKYAKF